MHPLHFDYYYLFFFLLEEKERKRPLEKSCFIASVYL